QVRHLCRSDLFQLGAGDLGYFLGIGASAALGDTNSLANKHGSGWGLGNEGKATVSIDRDYHRNRETRLEALSGSVECLTEFHNVDTTLTQCGTNGRTWVRLASCNLQLDIGSNFLCHLISPGGCNHPALVPQNGTRRAPLRAFVAWQPPGHSGTRLVSCADTGVPAVSLLTSCQLVSLGHAAADVGLAFFYLAELELHRRRTSENQHSNTQTTLLVIDFLDSAGEIIEGPINNPDHFTGLVDNLVGRFVLSVFERSEEHTSELQSR